MRNELEGILRSAIGERAEIARMSAVSGGCIADAQHVVLNDGQQLFVKSVPQNDIPQSVLEAEAIGLRAIAQTNTLSVPEVILCSRAGEREFLVLEWIEQGPQPRNFFSELGAGLACLHRSDSIDHAGVGFGWKQDNFLGSSLQPNQPTTDWCQFFAEHRLGYQIQLAREKQSGTPELYNQVSWICEHFHALVGDIPIEASLLHGDLWNGNFVCSNEGAPVIFDPAVYRGHREADLAMPLIFGGFSAEFWKAYKEVWPLEPGFEERAELYKLYHYLNHLNLFGTSYLGDCLNISRRFAPPAN